MVLRVLKVLGTPNHQFGWKNSLENGVILFHLGNSIYFIATGRTISIDKRQALGDSITLLAHLINTFHQ